MRRIAAATAALFLASGVTGAASAKPGNAQGELKDTMRAMVTQEGVPPGQQARPDDPDQGDDNAAERAIFEVCTNDTPAAQRSAICDRAPLSPE